MIERSSDCQPPEPKGGYVSSIVTDEHKDNEITMKVLTVGATGKYASLVVPELRQRGVTVRALVRDESKSRRGAAAGGGGDEVD